MACVAWRYRCQIARDLVPASKPPDLPPKPPRPRKARVDDEDGADATPMEFAEL